MTIPAGQLVPLFAVTFDSTQASQSAALLRYKAMLLGQKLTAPTAWTANQAYAVGTRVAPAAANGYWYICVVAGTSGATAPAWPTFSKGQISEGSSAPTWQAFPAPTSANLVINKISSADAAAALYGFGSPMHLMSRGFKKNNTTTELSSISIADASAGIAATGTVTITGPATNAGTVDLYIDGTDTSVAVASGDTATQIALALALAINNKYALPVWATVTAGVITLTAKVKGVIGNDIDIRVNYDASQSLPAGVGATIVAMASGATNPDLSDIIAILGDAWYQIFVGPYTDTANMVVLETELARRALYNKKIYGQYITAKRGDEAVLTTFSGTRNSEWVMCFNSNKIPQSPGEFAAGIAGQIAPEASADPAVPMKTLPIYGILPPLVTERFDDDENNNLLNAGISTFYVDSGDVVRIQRTVTMYRKNSSGADDTSWREANTVYCNIYMAYDFVNSLMTKYPRAKLMNDGVKTSSAQSIVTPKTGKAFAIEKYNEWASAGIVENVDTFKSNVTCARSTTDANTLVWLLPPDLVNQFNNADITMQFIV
jgi:phage tail sheath gpL-like